LQAPRLDQRTADRSWLADTILPFRVAGFMAADITVSRRSNRSSPIKGVVAIAAAQ
jgi:hypothetical protein